ncbi:SPAG5 protein, partial [Amia calva]|nr:SPAG5 protein [Amia calva]
MLSGLRETVSELCSSLPELRATEAAEKKELRRTLAELQEKNSALTWKYDADVENLREQLHALRAQAEKDQVILQQKIEEEKRLKKACKEMEEYTELFQQQRLENTVLRTELAGVKHSLQQAQVEARTLREEMLSSAGHTGQGLSSVDEKILLRKELENLKRYAMEMEESRSKLLDRAKRHRSVYEENQRKMEQELHCLDDMIETVRKTLSSIPSVVDGCPELQELKCYVN